MVCDILFELSRSGSTEYEDADVVFAAKTLALAQLNGLIRCGHAKESNVVLQTLLGDADGTVSVRIGLDHRHNVAVGLVRHLLDAPQVMV